MSQEVIEKINGHKNYLYDAQRKKIINLTPSQSDIDAFLQIQHILDSHHIPYKFEKEFHIQILNV